MIQPAESREYFPLEFSVVAKVFMLFSLIIGSFGSTNMISNIILFSFAIIFASMQGYFALAKSYAIFFSVLGFLLLADKHYNLNGIIFSGFYTFLIWRSIPVFIASHMLVITHPGQIVFSMLNAGLPNKVTLMVVVALRFVPTVLTEIKAIMDAMRIRRLLSPLYILIHPVKTLEYIIIPLMIRSLNIADELTISAITRGVERPGKKHSYYKDETGPINIAFMFFTVIMVIYILGMGKTVW